LLAGTVGTAIAGRAAWACAALADTDPHDRILVVVELSGGNDGLNMIVPHGDDAYYRLRPNLAIPASRLLPVDDRFGFNPGLGGLHALWREGQLAVVHGCGYADPSYSHFTSMAYWQTAAPNSGNSYGWVGRLADTMAPRPEPGFIVNVGARQSLAVTSRLHSPVVFDNPARFQRQAFKAEAALMDTPTDTPTTNATLDYLRNVASSARNASAQVRAAWADYRTNVDYGIAAIDLDKVAACIAAHLPARLYYVSFRNNAFDTHVQQADLHQRLLTYASDAIAAFVRDMARIGRANDVVLLAFSEFGRRAPENTSLGTDHGTAGPMLLAGAPVRGGHHGTPVSLDALDEGDNLVHTTDFRRVYASVIDGWLAPGHSERVLAGRFEPLPLLA
jgi:uncharacterized protein (DUF1501 family)